MTAPNPAWIDACAKAIFECEFEASCRQQATAALSVLTPLIEAETVAECAKIAEECGWTVAAWAIRNAFPAKGE